MQKVYQVIASTLDAKKRCAEKGNTGWHERHSERIAEIMQSAPSGSGFNSGTKLLEDESNINKLVFETGFHHMNDDGYYTKWTDHKVVVRPQLVFGLNLEISGKDYNLIKEYIYDVFYSWLEEEVK